MNEFSISAKLLELRKAKGATQDEVAAALDVSNKTISKWENGASEPDLDTLVKLSRYYNVTTDTLLGLKNESVSAHDVLLKELRTLKGNAAKLKAFDYTTDIVESLYGVCNNADDSVDPIPTQNCPQSRYCISTDDFFDLVIRYDQANIAVMLLKNKANFAWMLDGEKQKGICKLLSALATPEALSVCWFIHNKECSNTFTAEYIAGHTGVDVQSVVNVLESFCDISVCTKRFAHLKDGEVTVYDAHDGDGSILSIIMLAFEVMYGQRAYRSLIGSGCKLIGGAKK